MTTAPDQPAGTMIHKRVGEDGEIAVGYLGADQIIYKLRWDEGQPVGRIDAHNRVFRRTAHDERELGYYAANGAVYSHGLFEGGAIGWVDPDGVVIQAGLILGEEEVGRCAGPQLYAAGAALLLFFLPEDAEANRRL